MPDEILAASYAAIRHFLGDAPDTGDYAQALAQVVAAASARGSAFSDLPLLCCEAVGGPRQAALPAASAWYLLLVAARLLDDLADEAPPAAAQAAAQAAAPQVTPQAPAAISAALPLAPSVAHNVAAGLIFAAFGSLARVAPAPGAADLYEDFCRSALRVGAGQHADLLGAEMSLERAWDVVGAKAGEPFALGCRAGARAGGGRPEQVAACSEFGYHLGVLTQIGDDIVGIWRVPPGQRGDLAAGRRTAPVIYALTTLPPAGQDRLRGLLQAAGPDGAAEGAARQMLTEAGALQYLLLRAELYHQSAAAALTAIGGAEGAVQQLAALLAKATPWRPN